MRKITLALIGVQTKIELSKVQGQDTDEQAWSSPISEVQKSSEGLFFVARLTLHLRQIPWNKVFCWLRMVFERHKLILYGKVTDIRLNLWGLKSTKNLVKIYCSIAAQRTYSRTHSKSPENHVHCSHCSPSISNNTIKLHFLLWNLLSSPIQAAANNSTTSIAWCLY